MLKEMIAGIIKQMHNKFCKKHNAQRGVIPSAGKKEKKIVVGISNLQYLVKNMNPL